MSPRLLQTSDRFALAVEPSIEDPWFTAIMARDTWYEPEMPFLRRLGRPGLRVLDIDHGIGYHTLLLASLGATVYAVLPDANHAALCRESVQRNNFAGVEQINVDGKGELFPDYRYDRLDTYQAAVFAQLDLVRLGHPTSLGVVEAAGIFLQRQSPLLMLEITGPADVLPLAHALGALGYQLLRYVPGLQALMPASVGDIPDFVTNIFFCKADRLQDLVLRELAFLPAPPALPPPAAARLFQQAFVRLAAATNLDTLRELASLPLEPGADAYMRACTLYLMAISYPLPLADRFACLEEAQRYFQASQEGAAALPCQLGLILADIAIGRQGHAVRLLETINFTSADQLRASLTLPFLVDEAIAASLTAPTVEAWLQAYLLELYETMRQLPGRFTVPGNSLMGVMAARELYRFQSQPTPAIEKRRILAAAWLGLPHRPFAPALLQQDWLNVAAWRDFAADDGSIFYYHSVYERDLRQGLQKREDDPFKFAVAACISNGVVFKTYMDIGSAEGTASIYHYASGLLRNMRIVNVDPNELYRDGLEKIAAATGGLYIQSAISDYEGEAQLQESGHEYWASLRPAGDEYWNDYRHSEIRTRTVPVETIATLVRKHDLQGPIILKLDVQGLEEAVLRGMADVADQIGLVVVETFAVDMTKIHNALDRLGFSLFDITTPRYYQRGILGWFYPYYINNRYMPLFQNAATGGVVDDSLLEMQRERRRESELFLEEQLAILAREKALSDL